MLTQDRLSSGFPFLAGLCITTLSPAMDEPTKVKTASKIIERLFIFLIMNVILKRRKGI